MKHGLGIDRSATDGCDPEALGPLDTAVVNDGDAHAGHVEFFHSVGELVGGVRITLDDDAGDQPIFDVLDMLGSLWRGGALRRGRWYLLGDASARGATSESECCHKMHGRVLQRELHSRRLRGTTLPRGPVQVAGASGLGIRTGTWTNFTTRSRRSSRSAESGRKPVDVGSNCLPLCPAYRKRRPCGPRRSLPKLLI